MNFIAELLEVAESGSEAAQQSYGSQEILPRGSFFAA
jgi:hypothetical protein